MHSDRPVKENLEISIAADTCSTSYFRSLYNSRDGTDVFIVSLFSCRFDFSAGNQVKFDIPWRAGRKSGYDGSTPHAQMGG